jgi:hypothetical protein
MGHQVTVVTAQHPGCPEESEVEGVRVLRVGHAGFRGALRQISNRFGSRQISSTESPAPASVGALNTLLFQFFQTVIRPWFFPDEFRWFFVRRAQPLVFQLIAQSKPDLMVTVSKPFSTHLIGLAVKDQYPDLHWMSDHGDPFALEGMVHPFFARWQPEAAALEQKVLTISDRVAVTNHRTAAFMQQTYQLTRSFLVIPPVLDTLPMHIQAQPRDRVDSSIISIAYFGSLYKPDRPIDGLLRFCSGLRRYWPKAGQHFRILLYGTVQPSLLQRIENEPLIRHISSLPREKSLAAMVQTEVLLNIGNLVDYTLPSKAVEYLAANRPIVHLTSFDTDVFSDFMEKYHDAQSCLHLTEKGGGWSSIDYQLFIDFCNKWNEPRNPNTEALQQFSIEAVAQAYLWRP